MVDQDENLSRELRHCAIDAFRKVCKLFEKKSDVSFEKSRRGVAVNFWGPCKGTLTLRTSGTLETAMVEGMFGLAGAVTREDRDGTLKEMCNIICGQILVFIDSERPFTIGVPKLLSDVDVDKYESDPVSIARLSFTEGHAELLLSVSRLRP